MSNRFVYVIHGLPDDESSIYWSNMIDAKAYAEMRSPYAIKEWLDYNQGRQSYALPVGMEHRLIAILQHRAQAFRHDDTPAAAPGGDQEPSI